MYGPTEATVIATETMCPPSVTAITIGRPVQNMHAYIVDSALRPVPVGEIDYLCRIDRQVKITGVRIELGDVESALETAPGVSAAVASAVPGPDGVKRLVCYVSPASADPAVITAHCRAQLIPAMVPS